MWDILSLQNLTLFYYNMEQNLLQFCAGFSTSKGCRFSVTAQVAQDSLQGGAISGKWHNDYWMTCNAALTFLNYFDCCKLIQ